MLVAEGKPWQKARMYMHCAIRIKGHLDPSWQDWFEGLEMVQEEEGTTLFSGSLHDQAALYGILTKMCGLSLALLSLETLEPKQEEGQFS
jgi:hypothetical protein